MKTLTVKLTKMMDTRNGILLKGESFMNKPNVQLKAEGNVAKALNAKMQNKKGFRVKVDDNFQIVQFWALARED